MSVYTNMKEVVHPANTVLVVWDVQNMLVRNIFNHDEFLENIKRVIASARKAKIPVIYSKITPMPKQYESNTRNFMLMENIRNGVIQQSHMARPSPADMEIHEAVAPEPDDVILEKYSTSIFIGTPFHKMMNNRGVTTILLTGISTDIGIDSSARDAANREFYTIVLEDCVSSSDRDLHEASLKTLKKICMIKNSQEIIDLWG